MQIQQNDGSFVAITDVSMVPVSLVILAETLAEETGLSKADMIWIGSPSWVVSGLITDQIMMRMDRAKDAQRLEDARKLLCLAMDSAEWIPVDCISGAPTGSLETIEGFGPRKCIFTLLPDQTGWFNQKSNFAGISRNRERKAKESLRNFACDYVIPPWSETISFGNRGVNIEIAKDRIAALTN